MSSGCGPEWTVWFPRQADSITVDSYEEAEDEAGPWGYILGPWKLEEVDLVGRVHKQDPALVAHYLKVLERPVKRLTAHELQFVNKVSDEYRGTGRLPAKAYGLLERLAVEKAHV